MAQSVGAVGGTKQAFAENDEEMSYGGRRQRDGFDTSSMPEAKATAEAHKMNDDLHLLNVTA